LDIEFKCKYPFSDDLLDTNSEMYKNVSEMYETFFEPFIQGIADKYGFTYEMVMTFSEPVRRKRRDTDYGANVKMEIAYKGLIS
jgi:hypothetical protein